MPSVPSEPQLNLACFTPLLPLAVAMHSPSLVGPLVLLFTGYTFAIQVQFRDCEIELVEPSLPKKMAWVDPRLRGGQMLDIIYEPLRGEPLNAIISGLSNPEILTDHGFKEYSRSIGFSDECLGLHLGGHQYADLGDGLGVRSQQLIMRQTWRQHIPFWGTTCWESFNGGNHFRAWQQNGTLADTKAWFLAVSQELTGYKDHHNLVEDGYNVGRDLLVARALARDALWEADVVWVQGLLDPGIKGVNHRIPLDGLVAVITVGKRKNVSAQFRSLWSLLRVLLPFLPL
ncbi:hypothetical protein BKA62DRAFT_705676 [Auriculariales sp. MPI-PUGE-AT-0066]|nr:hypothetical protein BKA62DRAFT_705676 [Auriculariales sp. MPI-PUGE-AT-0066]